MKKQIAVLPGDGIGPEITTEAVKVLKAIEKKFNHEFLFEHALIGGAAYEEYRTHLPQSTLQLCKGVDAILLGAIGGPIEHHHEPKWHDAEKISLLALRKELALSINIRPITLYPTLLHLSPLKPSIVEKGIDFIIIRELIGGIYFGEHTTNNGIARDIMEYTEDQIALPVEFAFKTARKRNKKVTLVDKANVLDCSRLWRSVTADIAKQYADIELEYMYVDNAAMQIIKNPAAFDVMVTSNMFGDILSDEASAITGSLGMMPSASIGKKYALYEPSHGSYPKAAGLGTANPIATILSAALMLEYSFGMHEEAKAIRDAVRTIIEKDIGTRDIIPENPVSTSVVGNAIVEKLSK